MQVNVTAILRFLIDIFAFGIKEESVNNILIGLYKLYGSEMVKNLFKGLIYSFTKDRQVIEDVAELFYTTSQVVGYNTVLQIVHSTIEQFPIQEMSNELKSQFIVKFQK
jgi:hypothetical protein